MTFSKRTLAYLESQKERQAESKASRAVISGPGAGGPMTAAVRAMIEQGQVSHRIFRQDAEAARGRKQMPKAERTADGQVVRQKLNHKTLEKGLEEANGAANAALEAMRSALDREAAVRALTADTLSERRR